MDEKQLDALRDYYDNTDTADQIADAELDTSVVVSPMIGITIRLPQDVLQEVRGIAADAGVKPTALIRRWIEERVEQRPAASASSGKFGGEVVHVNGVHHAFFTRKIDFHTNASEIQAAKAFSRI